MEGLCGRDIKDDDHSDFSGGSRSGDGDYEDDDVDGMTKILMMMMMMMERCQ